MSKSEYICVCVHVCVLFLSLWRLDIWQLNFATTFSSFCFYFCVIFRSTGRENWQSSRCRLPDGDDACWTTRTPMKGCVLEGWPFKEKKTPQSAEVSVDKSFSGEFPCWSGAKLILQYQVARLEERWMNVWGDYRVPVLLAETNILAFRS